MEACVTAQEVLYENNELTEAFQKMLRGYNETCHDEGLCTYQLHEETMASFKKMNKSSTVKDIDSVKGSGTADFSGAFLNHLSYQAYATACGDAGGDLSCVDANLIMEGEAGEAFLQGDGGIETDVRLTAKSYPVCMTKECENEDMVAVLENTAKNAFLKSPQIAEQMTSQTESLIKAANFKQVCALSGLETCEMIIDRKTCSSSSVASVPGRSITMVVIASLGMLSIIF